MECRRVSGHAERPEPTERGGLRVHGESRVPEPHPAVAGYDISEPRFSALLDFIEASFARGQGGPVFIPGAGYAATDGFYEANGAFNALVGCNTWTAKALRIAGLRTGWWNPLPWSLGLSMQLYNHDQARTARP